MLAVYIQTMNDTAGSDDQQILIFSFFSGYLFNPTDICENCVIRHLKVSYYTIFTDRMNTTFCHATKSVGLFKYTFLRTAPGPVR
jgi:hypothetical protein